MQVYLDLLKEVKANGAYKSDRTGTGTYAVFGRQVRYDLTKGFPLLTTKKVYYPAIFHELLWFLSGDTNIKYLQDNNVRIWNEWADEKGDLGKVYGYQWRKWNGGFDQITNVINQIKTNPDSRRLIVSSWNASEIEEMALPPCHCFFQFFVSDGKLSCQLYQRSADIFLGVPFNIASYALLTCMVAQVCDLEVGDFVHTFGDLHLYKNHIEQAAEQLQREPFALPTLQLNPDIKDIFAFRYEDIEVLNYKSHSTIKAEVAV